VIEKNTQEVIAGSYILASMEAREEGGGHGIPSKDRKTISQWVGEMEKGREK